MLYQRMAKAFAEKGHEVHVICQSAGTPLDREDDRVFVHEVGSDVDRGSAHARINYSYYAWRKLRKVLGHGLDIVNAEYFLGEGLLYSLTKRKAPLVLQAHAWADGWLETSGPLGAGQRKLASYLERLAASRADKIIATSNATCQWLVEKAHLSKEKVTVIREFIDTAQYRPVRSTLKKRLGIPENARMVLFVAGMEPRKGPLILAQAIPFVASQIPESRFVFIGRDTNLAPGGGSMKGFMLRLAEANGFKEKLIFAGMVSSENVVEAYSVCDVFVYPGLLEAGGLPPLEAMACNCPVIATATGISAELKNVSPAFLVVEPGDPKALARAIVQLLSMPGDVLRESSAGHRKIVEERFNFERMVDEILAVYQGVTHR
jgi:glycosyltransferase involved in cell wall biosynthesis